MLLLIHQEVRVSNLPNTIRSVAIAMIEKWIIWLSTIALVIVTWTTVGILHDSYWSHKAIEDFQRIPNAPQLHRETVIKNLQDIEDWARETYCDNLPSNSFKIRPEELSTEYLFIEINKDKDYCYVTAQARSNWLGQSAADLDLLIFPFWVFISVGTLVSFLFFILHRLKRSP